MLIRLDKTNHPTLGALIAGGGAPTQTLSLISESLYTNNSPVQTPVENTGVVAADIAADAYVIMSLEFLSTQDNERYAINIRVLNSNAAANQELRILRTAEPVFGVGDVAFAAWVTAAGIYAFSIDVDGGEKTLTAVKLFTERYELSS